MRLLLLFFLLVIPLCSQAQYAETIRTGRPGAAIGAHTTGRKVFQVQTGVNFGQNSWDPSQKLPNSHSLTVIRYGLLERLEVSAVVGFSRVKWSQLEQHDFDQKGLSAAQIGFRINVRDGQGKGPNIGIQSRLKLNVLDEDFEQQRLASAHLLAVTQKLTSKLGLAANIGLSTSGNEDDHPSGIYVLNLNTMVNQKISVFIENYGAFGQQFSSKFDTGLGYLINNDLQLDASVGYGKNDGVQDMFVDFGLSWRTVGSRD
jgi:hypothetical protein